MRFATKTGFERMNVGHADVMQFHRIHRDGQVVVSVLHVAYASSSQRTDKHPAPSRRIISRFCWGWPPAVAAERLALYQDWVQAPFRKRLRPARRTRIRFRVFRAATPPHPQAHSPAGLGPNGNRTPLKACPPRLLHCSTERPSECGTARGSSAWPSLSDKDRFRIRTRPGGPPPGGQSRFSAPDRLPIQPGQTIQRGEAVFGQDRQ